MTSVVVLETLPVVSISVVHDQERENVGTFDLILATETFTPDPDRPLNISGLTGIDTGATTGYLGTIDLSSVTIESTGRKVLQIPVTHDPSYRGWGELTFTLVDGVEYTANTTESNRIVKVTIEEHETSSRTISVSAPDRIIEGEDIEVTLTNNEALSAGESIEVAFEVMANPTGFYDLAGSDSSPITMTDASNTASFTIATLDSLTLNTNGTIDISVKRGDQYEPASATAEQVTIVAKETIPTMDIARTSPIAIDEGEDAVFTVSASGVTLTQPIDVSYTVDEGSADFIDKAVSIPPTVSVATTGTGQIIVKTKADAIDESDGTITR